ncbi:MAG: hypothetical protein N3E41_06545 [Thermofilaceae archaeon]|nr:hypothetical protein [Thermofilaceae archaeon]
MSLCESYSIRLSLFHCRRSHVDVVEGHRAYLVGKHTVELE